MLTASMHMGLTFCYKYQEQPQTTWLRQGVPSAALPLSERWKPFSILDSNKEMALLIDMSKSKPQHGSYTQTPEPHGRAWLMLHQRRLAPRLSGEAKLHSGSLSTRTEVQQGMIFTQ